MAKNTILILGGTGDANKISLAIKNHQINGNIDGKIILSLAGEDISTVIKDKLHGIEIIYGGFGGAVGLEIYLQNQNITAIIDATHPYANQITSNAFIASNNLNIPICRFDRPKWCQQAGDIWHHVANIEDSITLAPKLGQSIFIATGSKNIDHFLKIKHAKILARMIKLPDNIRLLENINIILARGGFNLNDEIKLLVKYNIDVIITKNSGGDATIAKITAARKLKIAVIMIDRPDLVPIYRVDKLGDVITWLDNIYN